MARLVRAAASAPLPRRHSFYDAGLRTWLSLDALSSSPLQDHLLPDRHAVPGGNNPHCELHVPQLPCALAGISSARRWLCTRLAAATLEELGHAHRSGVTRSQPGVIGPRMVAASVARRCRHLSGLGLLRNHRT